MDNLCIIFIIFLFGIKISATEQDICKNGNKCVPITECSGLLPTVRTNHLVMDLLKHLVCGYRDQLTLICCPPEFMVSSPKPSVNNNAKDNILPDTTVCGIQNNDRIVGGTQTELDEHPWLALLEYKKPVGSGFYCGGMLISSRYVLTAAHCVKGPDLPTTWTLSKVRLGEWNMTSDKDCYGDDCNPAVLDVPIEEAIAHERYNPSDDNQQNDIAVLRMSMDVSFTDFVKPICLPLSPALRERSFEGLQLEVAGWGQTNSKSNVGIKLKVIVPVKKNKECSEMYKNIHRTITEEQICAGGVQGQSSCLGDSGGPLMGQMTETENWVAVGIVSYGPKRCGVVGWLGVYTRVTAYVNWIQSKLRP